MRNFLILTSILVVGVLAGAQGTAFLPRAEAPPTTEETLAYQTSLQALELKVTRLSQIVEALVSQQVTAEHSLPAVTREATTAGLQNSPHKATWQSVAPAYDSAANYELDIQDAEKEAAAATFIQDNFRLAETQYHHEDRDDSWSTTQQDEIFDMFQATDRFRGLQIVDVECRSRSCRLEVDVDRSKAEKHMQAVLIGELGRKFPQAVLRQEGNNLTLLISRTD